MEESAEHSEKACDQELEQNDKDAGEYSKKNDRDSKSRVAIKVLLNNHLAGSLIGTGGKAIKELMTVTNARVQVSGDW
jgi:hypothetical protein